MTREILLNTACSERRKSAPTPAPRRIQCESRILVSACTHKSSLPPRALNMSAFGGKADISDRLADVRE